ncbi:MAG: Holliday junction resolvase RuvX [Betaproteobacteria bacterium]|jgi:putative Holliday junction resolvase|nr:Holliday junction resolvase RuvX [Rhodocyclaceae bacterium]MCA3133331.1 Holliday junction resolvase RuvX [Rhodocyclaceae bacterium]MCA3142242.1 Holliday junction resolvase RuvX [Rhodocyclaceae bacterium]MCA3146469.1 Holliday junction resolvase RuvX [Rhodocyclaceae bacterium]MCE2897235.1 Holliday junction resolvase RuvX [Betaproteobacteria bacterium]
MPEYETGAAARPAAPRDGAVLAFDVGLERVGVAVGELGLGIAHPLETIEAADVRRRFDRIAMLVEQWRPALLVVGLPVRAAGGEHSFEPVVRRFVRRLEGRFGLPVALVDETLSSREAERQLAAQGVNTRRQRAAVDRAAAREILLTWFETRARAAA